MTRITRLLIGTSLACLPQLAAAQAKTGVARSPGRPVVSGGSPIPPLRADGLPVPYRDDGNARSNSAVVPAPANGASRVFWGMRDD
ncbi:hypothetical protein ASE75_04010 [Sphingomonas sp. Leaf17]|uniref:hypothetical protein n=1 Tax=Sphingomonas sp. Leaf17 TaxID=1735683 RepID=UPI0006F1F5CB|nr:hypothetical protein [Sphingomonas sp. Leaf17]KQM68027.1 hypothetical protein ASE75_04010 [Sphingomonas sp. Leaf17]